MDTKAIRDALERINAPWDIERNTVMEVKGDRDGFRALVCKVVPCQMAATRLHFIASAPDWLQQLLDENERLEKEKEKWRIEAFRKYPTPEAYDAACAALEKHRKNEEQLQSDKAVAVTALKWYADQENHEFPETGDYQVANSPIWDDGGDIARQALGRIETGKPQSDKTRDLVTAALRKAEKFIDAMMNFYGEGLQVLNWHQNGDSEPLDNFFDNNTDGNELQVIRAALERIESGEKG